MLSIVVLGTAAGGGVPQWNCGCPNCAAARDGHLDLRATQASIAISHDREHWFLINASPDLRQQITQTRVLHPRPGQLRHSPIVGVILTNGEVDAIAGLLNLREGSSFNIYAHQRVHDILDDNPIFEALNRGLVRRLPLNLGTPFEPSLPSGRPAGFTIEAFAAPGKVALFLEGREEQEGDTLGLVIRDRTDGQRLVFLAACAEVTPEVERHLKGTDLVFFDGTLWRDDEMIRAGLSQKTGQRMGHIAMSAAIPALADLDIGRKVFLHINNSNPALRNDSPERAEVGAGGWIIPHDGMEISL